MSGMFHLIRNFLTEFLIVFYTHTHTESIFVKFIKAQLHASYDMIVKHSIPACREEMPMTYCLDGDLST